MKKKLDQILTYFLKIFNKFANLSKLSERFFEKFSVEINNPDMVTLVGIRFISS
jgi:hypothetical protein